jgi:hypothetical protein
MTVTKMHYKGDIFYVLLPDIPNAFECVYKALVKSEFKEAILVPEDLEADNDNR